MARRISQRYFDSASAEINDLHRRYERGEVTDDELYSKENSFYFLQKEYNEQQETVDLKYPNAAHEQHLFDYLCEVVGISRQDHGAYALSPAELDHANREIWKTISELEKTWDKGDIYYPHPGNPDLRHALVRDLRDKKVRTRARKRNLADMKAGRPYRDPGALMADPPPKKGS